VKEIREIPAKKTGLQGASPVVDRVIVEEPLEIYVNDSLYTVTMRLVGEEMPLAVGLCFTDGIIGSVDDLRMIQYCGEDSGNRIDLYVNDTGREGSLIRRSARPSYSSCGICGSELITEACTRLEKIEEKTRLPAADLVRCQELTYGMQTIFKATGGAHAAALFNGQGNLLSFAEDVGRHNALDKAIGKALFSKTAGKACLGILTSRLSYEMVLKGGKLGLEILAGTSAATSLAVELASRINMTLIGFLRNGSGSVYTAPERILP
jgi:FdhD protein